MENKQHHALEYFALALSRLEEFLQTPIAEERDKAGIIQAFEYSFELAWKTIQKLSVPHSKHIGSPKQAFQAAFELGWIQEEALNSWIDMIHDRNLTSHTYQEDVAEEILQRIRGNHLQHLKELLSVLENSK